MVVGGFKEIVHALIIINLMEMWLNFQVFRFDYYYQLGV